jgi:hypothetical protein
VFTPPRANHTHFSGIVEPERPYLRICSGPMKLSPTKLGPLPDSRYSRVRRRRKSCWYRARSTVRGDLGAWADRGSRGRAGRKPRHRQIRPRPRVRPAQHRILRWRHRSPSMPSASVGKSPPATPFGIARFRVNGAMKTRLESFKSPRSIGS